MSGTLTIRGVVHQAFYANFEKYEGETRLPERWVESPTLQCTCFSLGENARISTSGIDTGGTMACGEVAVEMIYKTYDGSAPPLGARYTMAIAQRMCPRWTGTIIGLAGLLWICKHDCCVLWTKF